MQDKVEMNPLEIVQGQLPEIVNLDSKSETDSNAIKNASKMKNETPFCWLSKVAWMTRYIPLHTKSLS